MGSLAEKKIQQMALSAAAPKLPGTREELLGHLKNPQVRNLNDYVHDIVTALWPDPEFQELLEATYDVAAVEGKMVLDDGLAAHKIKKYAEEHEIAMVTMQKPWAIVLSMRVVLKRFEQDRKSRRQAVHGIVGE